MNPLLRTLPLLVASCFLLSPVLSLAEPSHERMVYKTIGEIELGIDVYKPEGWSAEDARPALVFYHGGGWRSGRVDQFKPHALHFAARGLVAMSVEYRLSEKHDSTPMDSTMDAKSAMRWVRSHADELGIDPQRIAAGGGSAGGHLAAALATITELNDPDDDLEVSVMPNALLLFNPALNLDIPRVVETRGEEMAKALLQISPRQHLKKGLPPTIIFHGTGDTTVPFATAEDFTKAAKVLGVDVELVGYENRPHGFFNEGRGDNADYLSTLKKSDDFLVDLGWLKAE